MRRQRLQTQHYWLNQSRDTDNWSMDLEEPAHVDLTCTVTHYQRNDHTAPYMITDC